jgi:hypothetical protein
MHWCDALEARLTTTAELEPCSPPFFRLRYALPRQATAPSCDFGATRRRIVKRILHLNLHREWFVAAASIPSCCCCESAISGWIFGGGSADTGMATRQPT